MSGSESARTGDALLAGLLRAARERPDDPLLLTPARAYTHAELSACASAIATRLLESGLPGGGRVALYAESYDGFFAALLGVWLAGGVAVPVNTTLPAAEAGRLIARAAPHAVLHDDSLTPPADDVPTLPLDELLAAALPAVPSTDRGGLSAALPGGPGAPGGNDLPGARRAPAGDEPAMILFTSGTTGVPKGVCQTMAAVTGNALRVAGELDITPNDRIFINTPPYFTSGICHFLTLVAGGGGLAAEAGFFFGEGLLDRLEELGCTGFGGAPAHLVRVVEPLEAPRRVSGLRFWVSSGDHLPRHTIDRARRVLPGVSLFNMYGLTEVSGRLCVLPPDQIDRRPGSVGRPIADMVVTARDEDGRAVPPDETGELYVSGPLVLREYLDDPAATAAALGPHGFRTGDFGHTDEEGYVWVAGRRDDIFKRGGEKVSTVQVQQALLALPGVLDCAVVAAADDVLGHVPVAFVVADESRTPRALLKELRATLPPASLPSRIVPVDAVPRTGSGKAVRRELLALLERGAP